MRPVTDQHICTDAQFLSALDGTVLVPHILRLLARGEPAALGDIAAAASRPLSEVDRLLRSQPGTDWDDDGRLAGFGLTLRPTGHRFTVAGKTLYTWCATDTLFFTVILGKPALPSRLARRPAVRSGSSSARTPSDRSSRATRSSRSSAACGRPMTCGHRCATTGISSPRPPPPVAGPPGIMAAPCSRWPTPSRAAAPRARNSDG